MEKWFSKFGSLKVVDASQDQEAVFDLVQGYLEEAMKKVMTIIKSHSHYDFISFYSSS